MADTSFKPNYLDQVGDTEKLNDRNLLREDIEKVG